MLASGGERGIGRLRTTPGWLRGRRSGPSCRRGPRAGRRSAQGWTPAGIPGCAPGCAPGGQQERRRRATPRAGGPAAGLPGGRLCVVTLCATCRERELLAAAGRRQSRVRGSAAFLRALLLLRSACLWQPWSWSGWTAPGGSARPAASGLQPSPPRPYPVFPRAPRRQTPVTVSDATVCVRSRKGQPPP